MTMMDGFNKFIGIKHYFGESSFDGCDCIGLCRLFYKEHGWPQTFTDDEPEPVTKENYAEPRMWARLYRYLLKNFTRVDYDDLDYGDVVVMNFDGDEHLGIYLEYGKVLGMQVPTVYGVSQSTIYPREWWTPAFKYGFRRKKQ